MRSSKRWRLPLLYGQGVGFIGFGIELNGVIFAFNRCNLHIVSFRVDYGYGFRSDRRVVELADISVLGKNFNIGKFTVFPVEIEFEIAAGDNSVYRAVCPFVRNGREQFDRARIDCINISTIPEV